MQMPILKKDSEVWKLAIKYCRRKYTLSKPIELLSGDRVKFKGLIYGNEWIYTQQEIETLLKGNK